MKMLARGYIEIEYIDKRITRRDGVYLFTEREEADIGYGVVPVYLNRYNYQQQAYAGLCPENHPMATRLRVQRPNGSIFAAIRHSGKAPMPPKSYKIIGTSKLRTGLWDSEEDRPANASNDTFPYIPVGTKLIIVTGNSPVQDLSSTHFSQLGVGAIEVFDGFYNAPYNRVVRISASRLRGHPPKEHVSTSITLHEVDGKLLGHYGFLQFYLRDTNMLELPNKQVTFNLTFWG